MSRSFTPEVRNQEFHSSHISTPSSPNAPSMTRLTFCCSSAHFHFLSQWFWTPMWSRGINALTSFCDSSLQKEWVPGTGSQPPQGSIHFSLSNSVMKSLVLVNIKNICHVPSVTTSLNKGTALAVVGIKAVDAWRQGQCCLYKGLSPLLLVVLLPLITKAAVTLDSQCPIDSTMTPIYPSSWDHGVNTWGQDWRTTWEKYFMLPSA